MRLLDRVAQEREPVRVALDSGTVVTLPGADVHARAVSGCAQRFVLDTNVSDACRSFFLENTQLFSPENTWLRMPGPEVWVEWFNRSAGFEEAPAQRTGVLFRGEPGGRSGRLRGFWEEENGQVSASPGELWFDLDAAPSATEGTTTLTHSGLPGAQDLLNHAVFVVDQTWRNYYQRWGTNTCRRAIGDAAENCWFDLPMTLSFALLLTLNGPLMTRSSDLEKFNRVRMRRGRPALLDHAEVRLALGESLAAASKVAGFGRVAPRLHQVRGHVVHRGDQLFWRNAHLRGDRTTSLLRRTVRVGTG